MKILTRIWNWRPGDNIQASVKYRALEGMLKLLAAMACCTLLARGADSAATPMVQAESPRRMALTREFSVSGLLELPEGIPVLTPENLPVVQIHVKEGDSVEAGDLLVTLDVSEVRREIQAKNLDAAGLEAQMEALEQEAAAAKTQARQERIRAREDMGQTEEKAHLDLLQAEETLRAARDALRKYDGLGWSDFDQEEGYSQEEFHSLRSAYRTAQIAYDQALLLQDDNLQKAQRALEDAEPEEREDAAYRLHQLSLQKLRLEVSALEKTAASGGEVRAPAAGVVKSIPLSPGGRTTGQAAALLSDGGFLSFTVPLDGEQRERVKPGDLFSLTLPGSERTLRDIPVLAITPDPDEAGRYLLHGEVEATKGLAAGQGATALFASKTPVYDITVPLSALYGSKDRYYVLAAREGEDMLGPQVTAERVDVQLLEQNGTAAAVSGLGRGEKVITQGDGPVREGDRVRVEA